MSDVLNIAHRGASAYAPENTFAAYDLAVALSAHAIELDVRETRDGNLVVIHDDTITRTTSGPPLESEAVADLRWEDIVDRDSGGWFNRRHPRYARPEYSEARIPRLEDVFDRYGRDLTYFIELKHPPCRTGMEASLVELVRRHQLVRTEGDRPVVVVEAFSQPCLKALRDLEPDLSLVQLFHSYATASAIRSYLGALPDYCMGVGPCKDSVDERLLNAAVLHSLKVYAWTANEPAEMAKLVNLGVDGLVTDFPDTLDDVAQRSLRRSPRHATSGSV